MEESIGRRLRYSIFYIPLLGWIYGLYGTPDDSPEHFHGCQAFGIFLFYLGIAIPLAVVSLLLPPVLEHLRWIAFGMLAGLYGFTLLIVMGWILIRPSGGFPFFEKVARRLPF